MSSDESTIATTDDGIVTNKICGSVTPLGSTSTSIAAMAAATGLEVIPNAVATVDRDSGRSGRMPDAYETSYMTGMSG